MCESSDITTDQIPDTNAARDATLFLVTYELRGYARGFNYRPLMRSFHALGALRTHWSSWYVGTELSELELFQYLSANLDSRDQITVVPVLRKPVWGNALEGTNDFVAAFFP